MGALFLGSTIKYAEWSCFPQSPAHLWNSAASCPENAASVCKRSVQLDGGFQVPKGKKSRKNLHRVRVLSDFLFRFFSLGNGSQDGNSK